ncbi:hypothetical protein AAEX28_06765 [Lentisphaerota bacterium WC36G]|nr:hypothetical protein LJT99_09630 [Lentisphaerae bacterium WC36]
MKKEYLLTNMKCLLIFPMMLCSVSFLFLGLKTSTYKPTDYKKGKEVCIIELKKYRNGISQVKTKLHHNFGQAIKVSGTIYIIKTNYKGVPVVAYINVTEINDKKLKKVVKITIRNYNRVLDKNGKKVNLIGYETLDVGGYPLNVVEKGVESLTIRGYSISNTFVWMYPHTKFKSKN